ncbi:MAG TPA: hypothetical protein VKZ96_13970 [Thermomicrobiales bacterium]|nr:hypothetical protein [Thermomicrobiales bacterium]
MGNAILGIIGLVLIAVLVWINHRLRMRIYGGKSEARRTGEHDLDRAEKLARSKSPFL